MGNIPSLVGVSGKRFYLPIGPIYPRLGISCFSTAGFESISHQNTETMECTVTTVTYPQTCTYICIYRYHRTNVGDFVRDLNNAIQDHKTDKLVIVGDMNLNTKKPDTKKRIQEEI